MQKGPSFVPNPTDINWYDLKRDFDKFVNKLRQAATKPNEEHTENENILQNPKMKSSIGNPPQQQRSSYINYRKEKTKMSSLETFIELIEKDIFKPENYRRIRNDTL